MKKILVIGSLMTDFVFRTSKMPSTGETFIGEEYEKYTGGKGANQAVAAARLGGEVSMIGKLGDDEFAKEHIESLKKEKIAHKSVLLDETSRTGVGNVTIDNEGNNKIIVVPGANLELKIADIINHKKLIKEADIIVLQLEVPMDVVYQCIDIAYDYNKTIIVNPAPAQDFDHNKAKKVDYFIPNEVESGLLTGKTINNIEDAKESAEILISVGYKNVIVTLGGYGAIFVNKKEFKYFDSLNVSPIDTTAAGDSFIGTLAYGLSKNWDIDQIIESAIKASGCTVTKLGSQPSLPTWRDIENLKEIVK
ncbi:ribokinase [Staphylococcus pseudoxylosus]|uniref:ribokinase n=1 Tax=Staphylococcus pseudoxylosus TaxID=2282419 RepID=UPI002DB61180|nr:ribokinase [Staphylococcus pseudoxylosus]MEB8085682.1 ribokinase [Staphylococcus pseudoxylosus]